MLTGLVPHGRIRSAEVAEPLADLRQLRPGPARRRRRQDARRPRRSDRGDQAARQRRVPRQAGALSRTTSSSIPATSAPRSEPRRSSARSGSSSSTPTIPTTNSIAAGDVIERDDRPARGRDDPEHGAADPRRDRSRAPRRNARGPRRGFVGHEDAAIRGIERASRRCGYRTRTRACSRRASTSSPNRARSSTDVDDDLLAALDNLDELNRFTIENSRPDRREPRKAPRATARALDSVRDALRRPHEDRRPGATVIGILASQTDDLDRLLTQLPKFNSHWIRNLNHRAATGKQPNEPGRSIGDAGAGTLLAGPQPRVVEPRRLRAGRADPNPTTAATSRCRTSDLATLVLLGRLSTIAGGGRTMRIDPIKLGDLHGLHDHRHVRARSRSSGSCRRSPTPTR